MSNRHPIKQWFITFPQVRGVCNKDEFVNMFPPNDYYCIAQEDHKDGGYHFHLTVRFLKGITHSKIIKWIEKKFPNDWKRIHLQAVRNLEDSVNYCKKEDAEFIECGVARKSKVKYTPEMADIDNVRDVIKKIHEKKMDKLIEDGEQEDLTRYGDPSEEIYNEWLIRNDI
jgi:hypothetical protein